MTEGGNEMVKISIENNNKETAAVVGMVVVCLHTSPCMVGWMVVPYCMYVRYHSRRGNGWYNTIMYGIVQYHWYNI